MDNAAPSVRILLVEDNEVFREALELMLDLVPDLEVVGAVGDGRSAVDACGDTKRKAGQPFWARYC